MTRALSATPAELWRRFRRFWRPPRTLKTTRVGRTYLVLTLGVGFGALNTGNNLLYLLLGLMLSISANEVRRCCETA